MGGRQACVKTCVRCLLVSGWWACAWRGVLESHTSCCCPGVEDGGEGEEILYPQALITLVWSTDGSLDKCNTQISKVRQSPARESLLLLWPLSLSAWEQRLTELSGDDLSKQDQAIKITDFKRIRPCVNFPCSKRSLGLPSEFTEIKKTG